MFCTSCGHSISNGNAFCTFCGAKVGTKVSAISKNTQYTMETHCQNFAGLAIGEFKIIIDAKKKYSIARGKNESIPITGGIHTIKVTYTLVKTIFTYNFTGNTSLQIGVDGATNTMKVELYDENGNRIPKAQLGLKEDLTSKLSKKLSSNEDNNSSCLDADIRIFGTNGQLFLYNDRVVITRKGAESISIFGLAGEKTIPMDTIKSVQTQESGGLGFFGIGYIQLSILGGVESSGGLFAAGKNENTVTITDNEQIRLAKRYIEDRIIRSQSIYTVTPQISTPEEIQKYGQLLKDGLINQQEYDAKKKELLGL